MKSPRCILSIAALIVSSAFLHGQAPASRTPAASATKEEIVQLPAFSISSESDTGYVGKSALSSTRIAVDISELPQSVKVLNNSFVKAINPFNLADVLNYTGGAQNGSLN